MKKIISLVALITIVFSSLNANAQPPWARAYGHDKHDFDRRDDRRDDRREDRHEDYRDYRRDDDRRENRGNYYQQDNRYVNRAPDRRAYYYYPRANVYYNPIGHNYYYPNNGVWISVNTLPRDVYLDQQYQEVYCNDNEDIWDYNRTHVDYYRPAPRPRVAVGINLGVRF